MQVVCVEWKALENIKFECRLQAICISFGGVFGSF